MSHGRPAELPSGQ